MTKTHKDFNFIDNNVNETLNVRAEILSMNNFYIKKKRETRKLEQSEKYFRFMVDKIE